VLRYMGMDALATAAVMLAVEASGVVESTQRGGVCHEFVRGKLGLLFLI
jgi:hypothetical protein